MTFKKLPKEIVKEIIKDKKVSKEPLPEKKTSESFEFSVFSSERVLVRKYSEDIHGESAKELAEMFALKINGEVK